MGEVEARLALATGLARAAGAIQREGFGSDHQIETKSAAVDLVTEVDKACEALIVEGIEQEFPGDSILAEEGGGGEVAGADWRWVIDPLDGTTNYAHGYPRFAVSIGIERAGERTVGVVYDPLLDEIFHATRGGGARLNERPIRVSPEPRLDRSLVATGFAYDRRSSVEDNLVHFEAFIKNARAVRRAGSAALDLCSVAAGRLEGYWELKLHPWDVAAGYLIVEEAGGRVSNLTGGPAPASGLQVLATNGLVHDAMMEVLGR